MRLQSKPWLFLALLAAAILAITGGVHFYRHRLVRSDQDMLRLLPHGDATVFYMNVEALRHAGVLRLLAGAKPPEEPDYRAFLRETHFDYTSDISALAGAAGPAQTFLVVRGRFDWSKLRRYAAAHGGSCQGDFCYAPASKAGRWASFFPIQSDVMGLALSSDHWAAQRLRGRKQDVQPVLPDEPVWIEISPSVLKDPASLPLALRIFAIALQAANPVILSLRPANADTDAEFELELNARCASARAAETMRNQLEIDTRLLKLELAREHAPAGPADLTGLLTGGKFYTIENRLTGTWPIHKELLRAFE